MLQRRKVYPHHRHGPRVAEALLLGIPIGALIALSTRITTFFFGMQYFRVWWFWPVAIVALLLPLHAMQRDCAHWKWRFLIGGLAVTAMANTSWVYQPYGGRGFLAEGVTNFVTSLAIAFAVGGAASLVLGALQDLLFGKPRLQNGALCLHCGYTVTGLSERRCPECGNDFDKHDLDASPRSAKRRWAKVGLGALAMYLLLNAWTLWGPHLIVRWCATGSIIAAGFDALLYIDRSRSEAVLCDYLEDGRQPERAVAAFALGHLCRNADDDRVEPSKRTLQLLKDAAITDPAPRVRRGAIQSLNWLDRNALIDLLPRILNDEHAEVRWIGLATTSRNGRRSDPRITPYLIQALNDPDLDVRRRACKRLKNNTGKFFPFDPAASPEQRHAQQTVWVRWWQNQH